MNTFPVIDMEATGANIHALRNTNNLTVESVRDYLGLESVQSIYKWQRGDSIPSVDNLVALGRLFHTPLDDIIITREI